jgi:hypothetical protein
VNAIELFHQNSQQLIDSIDFWARRDVDLEYLQGRRRRTGWLVVGKQPMTSRA